MLDLQALDLSTLPCLPLSERSVLPPCSAVYFAIDSVGQVQYIGKTKNLNQRWLAHHRYKHLSRQDGVKIAYMECPSELLDEIEKALIEWFQPALNGAKLPADPGDKIRVSSYIEITLKERLEVIARKNGMSLSGMIAFLLAEEARKALKTGEIESNV